MDQLNKVIVFFKNKKHIEAIVLAVICVVIISFIAGRYTDLNSDKSASVSSGDAAESKSFIVDKSKSRNDSSSSESDDKSKDSSSYKKEDKSSEIHDLLQKYYKDYAAGDTAALEKVASPISAMEKSYIKFLSKLLDSYDIKEIYTKNGVSKGSKLVSVYVQMHFKGLKSAAPGLDFFYVETDESGALHINNLYSSFNQTNKENDMDPTVVSAIASFEEQQDVVDLQTKVQQEYNEISLSDKDFDKFMSKTYPTKVKSWQSSYRKKAKAAAKKAAAKKKAEAKKDAEKKAAQKKKEAEKKKTSTAKSKSTSSKNTYVTTTETNLRKKPTIESDIIKTLAKGTKLKKLGTEGKWYKVSYSGKTGYVRHEYVKKASSSSKKSSSSKSSKSTSSSSKPKEGKNLLLKDTVNIRKKPSTSSDRLNLAYEGEKVLIVENRDDGWTKVKFKNKTGYVKTEFLK